MNKILLCFALLLINFQAHAFRCFITGVKTNCWEEYNVTINVLDAANNNKLTALIIPTGSLWARQEFECEPEQTLKYEATFNPIIWESEKDRVYTGLKFLTLPKKTGAEGEVWNLSICFATQFAEVPLPPEAGQRCECDMSQIPAVEI